MHVHDLLRLDTLDLTLLWGDRRQLDREISGVTAIDLADPRRFLQHGEIVLSGLVWWHPRDAKAKVDRFVTALRTAGAAALLAGEETHGAVPEVLIASCRAHGIPIVAVPAHTTFRDITEAVYLRQWGDLSRGPHQHFALPDTVRTELGRLLADDAGPDILLDRAFAHLGSPACYVLTATGRTVARTPAAPALSARQAIESLGGGGGTTLSIEADVSPSAVPLASPFDSWHLHLPDPAGAPPRVLYEIADVIGRHRQERARQDSAALEKGTELVALLGAPATDSASLRAALRACGLPEQGPYQVATAVVGGHAAAGGDGSGVVGSGAGAAVGSGAVGVVGGGVVGSGAGAAVGALTEALRHDPAQPFAVGRLPSGEAVAVAAAVPVPASDTGGLAPRLREVWPLLAASRPGSAPYGGLGAVVTAPESLNSSLAQARYALEVARSSAPDEGRITSVDELTTMDTLLAGVPADVRAAYRARVLGPLADGRTASHRMLVDTLATFLAHSGSWARTAEAMHLHVNTVHYRIERVEALTGRDLTRLDDKLDLRAALLCG